MHGDARDTIYKTDYQDGTGTEKLTNYMSHDNQPVRDRTGREMSESELEQFNEKADGKRNRHIIISPRDHDNLSEQELDRSTRRYMRDMTEERPTADYVYSVHDDKENGRDVHIAMTANDKTDLEMYPNDIERERKRAHEHYRQQEREREQEQQNDRDLGNGRGRQW